MITAIKQKSSKLKITAIFIAIILVLASITAAFKAKELNRLYRVITLFDENNIVENFRTMDEILPYQVIHKGQANFEFGSNIKSLPESFKFEGRDINVKELFENTGTTGLIVIQDNDILFEEYYQGNNQDTLSISWSVGKSFVSALIGIAIDEGYIKDISSPVSEYVPALKDSGYEGVSLKNVLQMSSGVRFNEDYADFNSDINRMGRVIALGSSINEFAASLSSERQAGEYNHYVSMDTQVLGMVLKETTGVSPSNYLEEKIWKKLGMQSDAKWLMDDAGMELAFGTLNVTLRDYARFGRLYMNYGNWDGQQIVPEAWVRSSVTPDAPHLQPGENSLSTTTWGYGYQWWLPESPQGDFVARGVYGQIIYVNPEKKTVIVKSAAYPEWTTTHESNDIIVAFFQLLANT